MAPELALVDPELRLQAAEQLPRLDAFDFLRFDGAPRRHPGLDDFGFLADYGDIETFEWRPPLPLAAAVYAVSALVCAFVIDALFVVVLAAVVLAVAAFG